MTSKPGVLFSQCNLKHQHHYCYKHWSRVPKCDWTPNSANFSFLSFSALPEAFHAFWYKWSRKPKWNKKKHFCYESVIHVSYSLATPAVKLLLLGSFSVSLANTRQRWKTDSWRARFRHTLHPHLKQIHHQLMHFTSVFGTEHGTIL